MHQDTARAKQYKKPPASGAERGYRGSSRRFQRHLYIGTHVLWGPKAWRKLTPTHKRCDKLDADLVAAQPYVPCRRIGLRSASGESQHDICVCLRCDASCFYSCAHTSFDYTYEAAAADSSHYGCHTCKALRISLAFHSCRNIMLAAVQLPKQPAIRRAAEVSSGQRQSCPLCQDKHRRDKQHRGAEEQLSLFSQRVLPGPFSADAKTPALTLDDIPRQGPPVSCAGPVCYSPAAWLGGMNVHRQAKVERAGDAAVLQIQPNRHSVIHLCVVSRRAARPQVRPVMYGTCPQPPRL